MKEKKSKFKFPKVKLSQTIAICKDCESRLGVEHLMTCKYWKKENKRDDTE